MGNRVNKMISVEGRVIFDVFQVILELLLASTTLIDSSLF